MTELSSLSDAEVVTRLTWLVRAERQVTADVIEHLVEVEHRRLYLHHQVGSLHGYCIKQLGYDEDAATKRNRVAKLALRLPRVLHELREGTLHLTGLFLLAPHLTEENAEALLTEARGKSRRKIEELIARWFPRPDVRASIEPLRPESEQLPLRGAAAPQPGAATRKSQSAEVEKACSGAGTGGLGRLEPLSSARVRVEFTARAELYDKLEKARELLSHAVPSGDLGELFERALDALLEREARKRSSAQTPSKPRKTRQLKPGSRHVPRSVERAVWERDDAQCTHVNADGQRCCERRFLTIEHRIPFALGGSSTLDNLCLLCRAHNLESAREVFGEAHIEAKVRASQQQPEPEATDAQVSPPSLDAAAKVHAALCQLGFRRGEASVAVAEVLAAGAGCGWSRGLNRHETEVEQLLRACLLRLLPAAS